MDVFRHDIKYQIKYIEQMDPHGIENIIKPIQEKIDRMNDENEWFYKLEKSILKEGIRNPLVIDARLSPHGERRLKCRYGGSRLMIAQKYNIKIQGIIIDHDNLFKT